MKDIERQKNELLRSVYENIIKTEQVYRSNQLKIEHLQGELEKTRTQLALHRALLDSAIDKSKQLEAEMADQK
ncbi:unnamed protein product [Cercopithifilaria johnstoni]|uniref:Uncharacterized protein n=1 Tax=Cercopithifilaria johnstoni TaxID=2874296 RepID=A0A8J2Q3U8_9BILA|nr:unnamed protein product [Cercopithifilaria johnstoni]